MNKNSKNWKERECVTCKGVFLATDWQIENRNRRFCSKKCRRHTKESKIKMSKMLKGRSVWNKGIKTGIISPNRTGKNFSCEVCKKEFYRSGWQVKRGKQRFCSMKCRLPHTKESKIKMSENHKGMLVGENNPNWKGGITSENDKIRKSKVYKEWTLLIYRKDNFECFKCGERCKSKDIVAHHLLFFSEHPDMRFNINNGITMCRSCHLKTHQKLRKQSKLLASLAFA